jgi:hypothetical protein
MSKKDSEIIVDAKEIFNRVINNFCNEEMIYPEQIRPDVKKLIKVFSIELSRIVHKVSPSRND